MFGKGISATGDILDLAAGCNVIEKSGAWYAYEGNKIGQGRENAKKYLEEHPDTREVVEAQVRNRYGIGLENGTSGTDAGTADTGATDTDVADFMAVDESAAGAAFSEEKSA